ncbi:MAG: hypothetical protein HZB16_01680 [Armatimonadetes bacterium]|nr:hypothetical protein [Armatimonadota bacterium]
MSSIDNGTIKVGVNLDLGGAITWVSPSGSDQNLINSFDWGRQIQMSHYSGPNPFAPNGKQPRPEWAGLGWNPIQSGDCYGHRSKLLEQRNDGRELYVKCVPMQWPLNNEPGECVFECWITLDGATAKVRSRMVNARSDKTQYTGRHQELPAVYTNGPWWKLMTYQGDAPYTGGELSQIPAKMPWTGWTATENWAALVDDKGFGLGIWEPGVVQFLGGFAGAPGKGGPKDGPTGYIAPLHSEILDWNITYEFQYTLIVGQLAQIRDHVYQHAPKPAPPVWRFGADRQHWVYHLATDTGWPITGELKVNVDQADPQMLSPLVLFPAASAPTLYVEAAYDGAPGNLEVFWRCTGQPGMAGERVKTVPLIGDGVWHVYAVDLGTHPEYKGLISQLRVDPGPGGQPGKTMRIRSIGFTRPEAK